MEPQHVSSPGARLARQATWAMVIGAMFAICGPETASAQSCMGYLTQQLLQAKRNAANCGLSDQLIASIDTQNDPDEGANCDAPIDVQSQQEAFNQCSRVYYCASFAYKCAIDRARNGEECQSAMQACLDEHHVPK